MAAISVAAIEEALSRGFIVEVDMFARRLRGLPVLDGVELKLQKLVWMVRVV